MAEGVVGGSAQLDALGRRFRAAGSGGLRDELQDRLQQAAERIRPDIARSARAKLPRAGGLADRVAQARVSVRRSSGGDVGVEVTADSDMDLQAINEGRVGHPVFGRGPAVTQDVDPGFFDEPIQKRERDLGQALEQGIEQVGDYIEGRGI